MDETKKNICFRMLFSRRRLKDRANSTHPPRRKPLTKILNAPHPRIARAVPRVRIMARSQSELAARIARFRNAGADDGCVRASTPPSSRVRWPRGRNRPIIIRPASSRPRRARTNECFDRYRIPVAALTAPPDPRSTRAQPQRRWRRRSGRHLGRVLVAEEAEGRGETRRGDARGGRRRGRFAPQLLDSTRARR